jgi:hypothetical protein
MTWWMWAACTDLSAEAFLQCDLELELVPRVGAPGDEISARGGPQTEAYDTAVRVGGVDAEVLGVVRACDECDDCRARQGCLACGTCTAQCDETCATTCQESVSFAVPDLGPGATTLVVVNAWGQSFPLDFEVLP